VRWIDLWGFFGQPAIWKRILLLMLFYSGIQGILVLFKPFMVDLGFSVGKIAFVAGIYGTGIGALCTLLAGWLNKRLSTCLPQSFSSPSTGLNYPTGGFSSVLRCFGEAMAWRR